MQEKFSIWGEYVKKRALSILTQLATTLQPLYVRLQDKRTIVVVLSTVVFVVLVVIYLGVIRAPASFPHGKIVRIQEGQTLDEVAQLLKNSGAARSAFWFKNTAILLGDQRGVIAGDYFFTRDRNLFEVTQMVTTGDFGLEPIKVTIPEGASIKEIAIILADRFNVFDPVRFIEIAAEKEGYLFPDTYYFLPNISEESVLKMLEETFAHKIEDLLPQIEMSGRSLQSIITMASIIEREARTLESRRIISGILWKRIEIGMPLQVDVTFDYINGKGTFSLTREDLALDSPYNTYVYKGLPPGPIASPSLDSIEAALTPTDSSYLYFLADHSGTVYYSETFDEHVQKKRMYLK